MISLKSILGIIQPHSLKWKSDFSLGAADVSLLPKLLKREPNPSLMCLSNGKLVDLLIRAFGKHSVAEEQAHNRKSA